jgi:hypothetical protein
MDYSAQLSHNQLTKFLDKCLDFYKDGYYSLESIDEKQCTPEKRKSMKNDFKEYFVGTKAKPKTINPKVLCVIEALLEADTSKIIEGRRKIKALNNKIKELEDGKQASIQFEVNQRRRELENEIREQMKSQNTDQQMRDTNRMLRYKDIMDKQDETIKNYQESYVRRELHDNNVKAFVELKEIYAMKLNELNNIEANHKKDIENIEEKHKKDIEKIEEKHKKEVEKIRQKLNEQSLDDKKKKALEKARQLEIQRKQLLAECGLDDESI